MSPAPSIPCFLNHFPVTHPGVAFLTSLLTSLPRTVPIDLTSASPSSWPARALSSSVPKEFISFISANISSSDDFALATTAPAAPAEASTLAVLTGSALLAGADCFGSAWIYLVIAGALAVALWCFWFSTLAATFLVWAGSFISLCCSAFLLLTWCWAGFFCSADFWWVCYYWASFCSFFSCLWALAPDFSTGAAVFWAACWGTSGVFGFSSTLDFFA